MDSKIAALGLDSETASKVEAVFKEILKDSYIPIARFNEVNESKKKLEETVSDRNKQIEDLGKTQGATDELKKQIEKLQAKNIADQKEWEASIKQMKTDKYIDDLLMENGILDAKYLPAVKAYLPPVDIDSEDSKSVFTMKLGEVKTTTLPSMFKSAKPTEPEIKGFHPSNPDNVAATSSAKDDGSYESFLEKAGYKINE